MNFKKSFSTKKFKLGIYQTIITCIVIVAIVIMNLLVTKANVSVDLTSDQKYTLTEDTIKMMNGLNNDITIYYIVQEGKESTDIEKVLNKYDALKHVNVEKKDPVVYPKFTSTYTDDEVSDNDCIVVNEVNKQSKHILAKDMLQSNVDYSTYQESKTLDVEGQVTAAVQALSSSAHKIVYYSKGHSEIDISSNYKDMIEKSNMELKETRLDEKKGIPSDCSVLIINGPTYDITSIEYENIKNYLDAGHNAIFTLAPIDDKTDMTNYNNLLKYYGVQTSKGIVYEDSGHCFENTQVMPLPTLSQTHDITKSVPTGKQTIAFASKGMTTLKDVRSTLTTESFMKTSKASFSKTNSESTATTKEDGDIAGPFSLGVASTDSYKGKTAKVVIFSSICFTSDTQTSKYGDFLKDNQYGNRSIALSTMNWLNGEETQSLAIPTRSLDKTYVEVPEAERGMLITLLLIVLPLAVFGTGFFVWFRRRRS